METLIYFGKVNLCWVLFYGCYWLLFRNHTFFRWNRLYLLFTLLVSFAVPLISFPETEVVVAIPKVTYLISDAPEITVISTQPIQESFPWNEILIAVYLLGFTFMLGRLIEGLFKLVKIIARNEHISFDDYTLILLPHSQSATGSFSFFKWLIMSYQDYTYHLDTILRHEAVHIRQHHSMDVMLIEIIKTVFWFNPALWFYKKSLQEIHEYLADEQAPNKDRYANFLVSYALHSPVKALTNHFFNSSLLKARIQMIYKNRTSRWLLGKYLMIIPVLILVVSLTAAKKHMLTPDTTAYTEEVNVGRIEDATERKDDFSPEPKVEGKIIAETVSIKGNIINKTGLPIRNATIVVKNSKIGTSSNHGGNFELNNIPANSKIVVSHVSYQSVEFDIEKSKKEYSLILIPTDNLISEVVIVGYGRAAWADKSNEGEKRNSDKKENVIVEQKAEFPGGILEMMKYLGRNIKYPTEAMRANASGIVIVSFVVNEYGNIRKAEVVKGLGFGLDDEAARVVWTMPKWSPAIQNGEAVASQHTIPIKFQIEQPKEKDKRQGFMNYQKVDEIKLADQTNLKRFKFESPDSVNVVVAKESATFMNYKVATPTVQYRYHKVDE
ncbi:M56 family metallopeptidase [Dyadobacter sp. CY312]|uniref:M56 family metallopeptidase n=1 Tax=Dyadobacter sp. CY312 TaxID=2907303 RepID=UPI001F3C195B|nr:M56 family metallopeptidase [Dyadobacter sp. CY312]MCE7041984.1 TonB family protein [Dyadobacter sp. CY312]